MVTPNTTLRYWGRAITGYLACHHFRGPALHTPCLARAFSNGNKEQLINTRARGGKSEQLPWTGIGFIFCICLKCKGGALMKINPFSKMKMFAKKFTVFSNFPVFLIKWNVEAFCFQLHGMDICTNFSSFSHFDNVKKEGRRKGGEERWETQARWKITSLDFFLVNYFTKQPPSKIPVLSST